MAGTYEIVVIFSDRLPVCWKFTYRKLWKILIDKDMKKKDLVLAANVSWTSVTKMSKGENVSMNILMKVCEALDCNIGDIVEFERDDTT